MDELEFAGQHVPVLVIEPTLEDAFKLDQHIKYLKSQLKKAEDEKKQIIEDHLKSNKMQEGSFRISDQVRKLRSLDARKFRELYPTEFDEIVETSIPIGKAEAAIGKNKLDLICSVTEQHVYSVEYIASGGKKNI